MRTQYRLQAVSSPGNLSRRRTPMSTLQTLDRGLRALDVISRHPGGISVADLAKELDVARAICYRIVATLEVHSLVARFDDGRIRLGAGTAVLASRFAPRSEEHTSE